MYLDLDDDPTPTRSPPDAPSWERLGAPMTLHLGGVLGAPLRTLEITAGMLRAAAASFTGEVAIEDGGHPSPPFACFGWIERVEMRDDELWGFVRWTRHRPLYGIAACLDFDHDILTRAPRLAGAIVRPAAPAMPLVAA